MGGMWIPLEGFVIIKSFLGIRDSILSTTMAWIYQPRPEGSCSRRFGLYLNWGVRRLMFILIVFLFTWIILLYSDSWNELHQRLKSSGKFFSATPSWYWYREEGVEDAGIMKESKKKSWFSFSGDTAESYENNICIQIDEAKTDIETGPTMSQFDFQPDWVEKGEFWDPNFEKRYEEKRKEWPKLPLKVIVVPHSHNDPGWLETFEDYFRIYTKSILDNMVDQLMAFKNMTFIWSEISFLSLWWKSAQPAQKKMVRQFLKEGRLEIATGGWVMTDEAASHIYAMVDQLIEGHQWVKNNLGVIPKSGWSIDPFGHGATMPYLLKKSGVSGGTIIQRIHYGWKQWLALKSSGDFVWRQGWDKEGTTDILVHNLPFDIYSIQNSCGPHSDICKNFDFRKLLYQYNDPSEKSIAIGEDNIKEKAEQILEQYGRTGSLFLHNVALIPIGDDFRYHDRPEWTVQYENYKQLFDYINNKSRGYNAEIVFGTLADYFREVKQRTSNFPTLKGDFFVYSDVFTEKKPAYWSGYFTTRPYFKLLDRELEANLRSAEILYTLSLDRLRRMNDNLTIKIMERESEKLQSARMSLGLFQHHDAITGTSTKYVMEDYAKKLFKAIKDVVSVQCLALQTVMMKPQGVPNIPFMQRTMHPESERQSFGRLPAKTVIEVDENQTRRIILFNSLAQARQEVIRLRVNCIKIRVLDSKLRPVRSQLSPVQDYIESPTKTFEKGPVENQFELTFIAELSALSVTTYLIEKSSKTGHTGSAALATVHCATCGKDEVFPYKNMQNGDIQLENQRLKILLTNKGFLKSITNKKTGETTPCGVQFAGYPSAPYHSGAYLFQPDPSSNETYKDVLKNHPNYEVVITLGAVSSKVSISFENLLTHSVEIFNTSGVLSYGVFIENTVDMQSSSKIRDTEMFMRFETGIDNGETPVLFTDQNGFQTQKHVKINKIGIEGNYYPITTYAYIEDTEKRLSLLVDHSMGAASWNRGWLEVMIDRTSSTDDARGMGEGISDNRRTYSKYWLLLEQNINEGYPRPTLVANQLSLSLMYPVNVFFMDEISNEIITYPQRESNYATRKFLTHPFPCDVHLMNLRNLHYPLYDYIPTPTALLIIHRMGSSCLNSKTGLTDSCRMTTSDKPFRRGTTFINTKIKVTSVTLTGLKAIEKLTALDEIRIKPMEIATYHINFF